MMKLWIAFILLAANAHAFAPLPPQQPSQCSSTALNMKVVNSLKTLKNLPGSQVIRRRGVTYVINKNNPKAKARQGGLSKKKRKGKK
jgi:large subunit ribosomal protein L36